MAGRLLRFAPPLAILAIVLAMVGVDEMAEMFGRTDWRIVLLALMLTQVQVLAAAWRWRFTAGRLGLDVPLGRAYLEYGLAGLGNMALPGGVAGDVMRTVRSARGGAAMRAAVRSVMLERFAGQAAFWVIAGGGLAVWIAQTGRAPGGALAALALAPVVAALAVVTVALMARRGPARVRMALAGLRGDAARAYLSDGALAVQAAVSLGLAASYVGLFALAGLAIGSPLPLLATITLIPLALLAMLVPIGVGGWGFREGAAAVLWPLAGLGAAEGAATAALYGLIVVAGSLPGLAALLHRSGADPSLHHN